MCTGVGDFNKNALEQMYLCTIFFRFRRARLGGEFGGVSGIQTCNTKYFLWQSGFSPPGKTAILN